LQNLTSNSDSLTSGLIVVVIVIVVSTLGGGGGDGFWGCTANNSVVTIIISSSNTIIIVDKSIVLSLQVRIKIVLSQISTKHPQAHEETECVENQQSQQNLAHLVTVTACHCCERVRRVDSRI
jgi:hypothetical protein